MKRWFCWFLPLLLLANSCIVSPISSQSVANPPPVAEARGMKLQVLGHINGAAMAVAIRDHYALLGFSYELALLDLVDPTQPQWVTSLPWPSNDVVWVGDYAYVVGRDGLAIVDLRTPTTPVPISTLALPDTASVVAVAHDIAYVAAFGDLYTIALADPQQPTILGVTRLVTRITGLAALGDELYAVTAEGFLRLDVSTPAQPMVLETLADPRLSYGPVIVDGAIYFGGKAALWVKASASAPPQRIPVPTTTVDSILDVAIVDGIVYLASGFQGLHIWDISDPTQAVALGVYPLSGLTKAVVAQGEYLYTIDCDEGLRVFDAANPNALRSVGVFTPLGISYALAVNDAFAYVAAGYIGGLHQLALADPGQAHTIAGHLTRSTVNDLVIADNYLYLAGEAGVGIIDLTTPTAPRPVTHYPIMNAWGLTVAGPALYVSDPDGNVWLLDRTDPAQLTTTAFYPDLGYAGGMAVDGSLAYIAHRAVGMKLLAVDQQGELTLLGHYPVTAVIHKIVVSNGYAYLALGKHGLAVVDVSDPIAPRLVNHYDTPGQVRDLAVQWPYLLVAAGDGGLQVLDMTDPAHLVEVASHQSCDGAYGVVSANGLLYVMQPLGGLWVLRLTGHEPEEAP